MFVTPSEVIARLKAIRDDLWSKVANFPTFKIFGSAHQDLLTEDLRFTTPDVLYVAN